MVRSEIDPDTMANSVKYVLNSEAIRSRFLVLIVLVHSTPTSKTFLPPFASNSPRSWNGLRLSSRTEMSSSGTCPSPNTTNSSSLLSTTLPPPTSSQSRLRSFATYTLSSWSLPTTACTHLSPVITAPRQATTVLSGAISRARRTRRCAVAAAASTMTSATGRRTLATFPSSLVHPTLAHLPLPSPELPLEMRLIR